MLEIWSLLYLTFLCDVKGCSLRSKMFMGRDKGQESRALELLWMLFFQIKIRLDYYKTIWKSNWNSSRQKHCSTKRIFVVCTQSEIVDFRVRRSPNALLNYVIISSKSSRITKLIRHGFLLQWELDLDLDFFPHWICWQKVSKFDDHWILILEMLLTIPQVREELRSALSSAYAAKL